MLDVLLEYDIRSDRSAFAIRSGARAARRARRHGRAVSASGRRRAGLRVASATPGSSGSTRAGTRRRWRFVQLGFGHILGGADHLLFLVCLVDPDSAAQGRSCPVVTAFAVAHSITLIASAFDLAPRALWFPPLIETLIALSIVYMAIENMMASTFAHRWVVAFGVRPGARLRLLVRAARVPPVRRRASGGVAAVVQRRRRARPVARARC